MLHLHNKLCEKSAFYRKWHDHPSHPVIHWMLFLMVAGLLTYAFVDNVGTGYSQVAGQAPGSPRSEGRIVGVAPEHVLVKFAAEADDGKRKAALDKHGMSKKSSIAQIDVHLVTVPPGMTPVQAAGRLKDESDVVEFAEPDYVYEPSVTPNDPWYANWQGDKRQIGAPTAWDSTTGAGDQIIAIADTGVDCGHEDLAGNCVAGWNFYDNNADTADVHGHGTSVAGSAAAIGNNGVGIAGVTWRSKIMPLRVSAPDGNASTSTIAAAVTYAADHGVKVVNNSYQTGGSATVRSAGQYLKAKGGLLVVSEGNYGTNTGYDNSPHVISVSAVDTNDALHSWSSFGNDVDVAAPGCTGATTKNRGGYGSFCGTSNAAPETSGVLMLVFAANPGLSADQAQQVLFDSARDLGASGWDMSTGWGRIDAVAAVQRAVSVTTTTPPAPASVTIVNFSAVAKTATTAVVTWTTDLPSTGVVRYGTTSAMAASMSDSTQGTAHSITLTGLQKSTKYYYAISAANVEGSATASTPVSTFRTKPK
jgi:thermitase